MGSSVTFRAVAVGAVLAGTFSLATAGNASAAEARPIVLACKVPAGAWPGHYGSIGNQQNGETVCVVLGGKLLVSLSAPAGAGSAWQNIVVSPAGILTPAPMPEPRAPGSDRGRLPGQTRRHRQDQFVPPRLPGDGGGLGQLRCTHLVESHCRRTGATKGFAATGKGCAATSRP